MIGSFAHRGLKRLYGRGDRSGVRPDMVAKVERILQRLDEITDPEQMALPGYRLHPLTGDLKGFWSVTVNGNWRVIFRFEQGQPQKVDLIDYH
ncbi:MAG: type II toxin-antitoxin system mRNA interferase toxin, RelE/StbE family [Mesorhizobium sp.]|nr:type II toxin-antitoxin system mRNA interferase toxin, RelE/StbE family [Mesorhizobium sp.]MBL8576659.1 type II toxin-antitoxin system mRNA interferase toxin, RelE/StbE family [Mesorhizobium sp.]